MKNRTENTKNGVACPAMPESDVVGVHPGQDCICLSCDLLEVPNEEVDQ